MRNFTYVPADNGREVVFRMSDFDGFVAANDYSGEPVYIDIEITNEGTLPVDAKGEEKNAERCSGLLCARRG